MHKNVFLFDLIKGLSGNEKRYVRIFLEQQSRGKENKYLQLFDLINKQKSPDEQKLKTTIANYAGQKNYLTESILESLRKFNDESDAEYVAHKELKHCMICFDKGLVKELEKRLKKLKKFCYSTDLFGTLFQVIRFEIFTNGRRFKDNEQLFKEMDQIIAIQQNFLEHHKIYHNCLSRVFEADARATIKISDIDKNGILNQTTNLSLSAKSIGLSASVAVAYANNDYLLGRNYQKQVLDLSWNNKYYLKYNKEKALMKLSNLLVLSYYHGDLELYQEDYAYMLSKHALQKGFDDIKFGQYIQFTSLLFRLTNDYSKIDELVTYFNLNYPKYKQTIRMLKETDISFIFATSYFKIGDFDQAYLWLNKVLNYPNVKTRKHLYESALTFELVLLFDSNDTDVIGHKSRAAYGYFISQNDPTQFELWFLKLLRKFPNQHNKQAVAKHFAKMKKQLLEVPEKDVAYFNTIHFDYLDWLDRKIKTLS